MKKHYLSAQSRSSHQTKPRNSKIKQNRKRKGSKSELTEHSIPRLMRIGSAGCKTKRSAPEKRWLFAGLWPEMAGNPIKSDGGRRVGEGGRGVGRRRVEGTLEGGGQRLRLGKVRSFLLFFYFF